MRSIEETEIVRRAKKAEETEEPRRKHTEEG